jgi:hypothetical protein
MNEAVAAGELVLVQPSGDNDNTKNTKKFGLYMEGTPKQVVVRLVRKGKKTHRVALPGDNDKTFLIPSESLTQIQELEGAGDSSQGSAADLDALINSLGE